MAYREKYAWLDLFGMVVAYLPYFVAAKILQDTGQGASLLFITLFAIASVARLAILGVGVLVLRRQSGKDARMPLDERDRAIERQSTRIAYYVLMIGTMIVGVIMPLDLVPAGTSGWRIANAALFAIVVAEVVQRALVVRGYRRGGHG